MRNVTSLLAVAVALLALVSVQAFQCTPLAIGARRSVSLRKDLPLAPSKNALVQETRLFGFEDYEDKEKGASLKVVVVALLGVFGLFGSDIIGGFSGLGKSITQQNKPAAVQELKKTSGDGSSRGALTRLTRKEINYKLRAVPLFVAIPNEGGGIFTVDGVGRLFTEVRGRG
jgi:hypothetical protein